MQYYQGDVCFEMVTGAHDLGRTVGPDEGGEYVVALGERTGHMHAVYGADVTQYTFEAPRVAGDDMIIGHVRVGAGGAVLKHEEHAPISLPPGLYRVRRQREYDERLEASFGRGRWVAD